MATDEETKAHIERIWAGIKPKSAIYAFFFDDIQITHASKGLVRARLPLTTHHVNSKGGLHGSVSATLVDWAGGLAISSWDLREKNGVSTDIHVTYVSSAKEGDVIEIEGKANKVGGTLAFTSVTISKVVGGEAGPTIATGTHTKFVKV